MPRSAVKLTPSAKGKLWDLQNRAVDLETKLQTITANNKGKDAVMSAETAEAVDRLRIPLCETMAEILLADAEFSWHYDVVNRLWRRCFYDRIGPKRLEVSRAKRRGKTQLATSLEASLNHFLAEAIVLYEYLTDKLEKKLLPPGHDHSQQQGEDASYTQTQSTQVTTTAEDENLDAIVPVLNLLYIHLGDLCRYANQLPKAQNMYQIAATFAPGHGHAYNQIAVVCQLKEQQGSSPLSAVALYWYCRSLLPTVSPFAKSATTNLNRLFASNREWLLAQLQNNNNENNAGAGAAVVTHATKAAAVRAFLAQFADLQYDFYKGIVASTTTTSNEQQQEQPATAAAVLKKMVKLTESFDGLLKLSAFGDALVCKMITILAFSECHVPTLATDDAAAAAAEERNETNTSNMLRATALVARTTTYHMATLLADRVLAGLRKIKAAGNNNNAKNNSNNSSNMSVRLLLPLLLVVEFTAHREATFFATTTTTTTGTTSNTNSTMDGSDNSHNINNNNDWIMVTTSEYEVHYKQALQAFWKKIVDVWNLLHPLAIATSVDETKMDGLQEYEALRGFAPFSSFITTTSTSSTSTTTTTTTPPPANTTDDLPPGFLTAQESVQVVLDKNYDAIIKATKSDTAAAARNNNNNNSTQETSSTKGSNSSFQVEQGRIKIARMLGLAKSLADDLKSELGLCICRMSTGEYAWIENKQEQEATAIVPQDNDNDDDDDHVMVDNFDSPQHVERNHHNNRNATSTTSSTPLVYQQAAGGGPALLVPGALLQNQGLPHAAVDQQNSAVAAAVPPPQIMSAVAPFGNVGFDSSRMTTREQPHQQQPQQGVDNGVDLHSMLLGGMGMPPPAPVNPPPGFGVPPPPPPAPPMDGGFNLQNMGLMPPGLMGAMPPSQPMQPMSESLHLFGGVSLVTANPFATIAPTANNNTSMHDTTINGSIIPPLRQEDISFLGGGGDDDEMAGVDLLGSGLLHSLWGGGEDTNGSYSTRNPFYTAS